MKKKFDTIKLEVVNNEVENFPGEITYNRCKIIINGKDILEYIAEAEREIYKKLKMKSSPGDYIHLIPSELFEYLQEARLSYGEEKAKVVCCTCGIAGCDSVEARVILTKDSIVWKEFNKIRFAKDYGLFFEFDIKQYENFIEQLKNTPDR